MTNKTFKPILLGILLIIVLVVVFNSFTIVTSGSTGVVLNFGAVSENILTEGIHFKIPIVQNIKIIDSRIKKLEIDSIAASKDLQEIRSKIVVNYRVNPSSSAKLYKTVGLSYADTIIAPSTQESIKAVTAKYTAEQLITERQTVSVSIRDSLSQKMKIYGIDVDNFNIINFEFSEGFNAAIEAKQTAQQLALKAKQDLDRIKIEAEQKIAQAKAEAESLRVQKQEITAELLKLREIEAKIKAIEKWDGKMPQYVSGDSSSIFNIPLK
jgi:regulator of protease activity HflC (stomatin/prohibitin superfamily)